MAAFTSLLPLGGLTQPKIAARPAQTNPAAAFDSTGVSANALQGKALTQSAFVGTPTLKPGGVPNPPGYTQPPSAGPATDMVNPGVGEQTFNSTQNRLQQDPYADQTQALSQASNTPTAGENYQNQNLGTLDGPGQGDQYWNQVSGQFNSPGAGENFAQSSTAAMSPQGPASAFYNQAMGDYGNFTGYSGPQASAGQYGANAASGPTSGQQFYNQVAGNYGTTGTYSDPNLAAGQYGATQQAFGALPIAQLDPFYNRAEQLGVQNYNNDAASRGVYGSSQALSGVGNVVSNMEAQRAKDSFDAQMQIEQANQGRQTILGNQARAGDLSSLSAFGANLSGVETFGNLANAAGQQTINQQTMLGNQANNVDQNAQAAQNSNLAGVSAFGNLANSADTTQATRYADTNTAMNNAENTAISRGQVGANISQGVDTGNRNDFTAGQNAASSAAQTTNARNQTTNQINNTGSTNDLSRLNAVNNQAQGAEGQNLQRLQAKVDAVTSANRDVNNMIGSAMSMLQAGDQQGFENTFNAMIAPALQAAGMSKADIDAWRQSLIASSQGVAKGVDTATPVTPTPAAPAQTSLGTQNTGEKRS